VVSITIIHAHKKEGHGAAFLCPITKLSHKVAGILFVDDTDITHLDASKEETPEDAHHALQASIDSWSQLLIATGGSLKPEKCFFHLISFHWDKAGKWAYAPNHLDPTFAITVPLPSGERERIAHLAVTESKVTLGVASSPDRTGTGAMTRMNEKAMEWVNKAKNSSLGPRDVHAAVTYKFWPSISYGLCANSAEYEQLVEAMHKPYYILAPLGGLARSAKRELRYLDAVFLD
jgi:hypothetical protein